MADVEKLSELLIQLKNNTDGESVSFGDLLNAMESRSFGPLLLMPSIIALSPVGAIPGMSVFTGSVIFLIAVQMLFSTRRPWFPKRLLRISFHRDKVSKGLEKAIPWAKWIEKAVHVRLQVFTMFPFTRAIAGVSIGLALLFFPLAVVPMGVAIPSSALVLFSLGLTSKDGLLVIFGFVMTAVSTGVAFWIWPF